MGEGFEDQNGNMTLLTTAGEDYVIFSSNFFVFLSCNILSL